MTRRGINRAAWAAVWAASVLLSGCSRAEVQSENPADDGTLKIVTTVFPYYDFTRQIALSATEEPWSIGFSRSPILWT